MRRWMSGVVVVVGAVLLGAPGSVAGDDWAPTHHCMKPYRPYRFTSEQQLRSFKSEVEEYERCIDDFVEKQKDAVENHRNAAKRALDEWNSFVQFELR